MRRFELTGRRFGMLVVEKRIENKHGKTRWQSICDCGRTSSAYGQELTRGETTSCGCKRRKHGHCGKAGSRTPTYYSWSAMKYRCRPGVWMSKWYHDRGVRICKRWDRFDNFLADMGERPKGKTLDRFPTTRKIYNKKNCRWATVKEQLENRRKL